MTRSPIARSIRRNLLAGGALLTIFGGGFAALAGGMEVSGAVIAQGVLVVDSFVKKVQHQTGGIVRQIFVRDGDLVHEGDILLTFDETVARANLALITDELDELAAAKARAKAECGGLLEVAFPAGLTARANEPAIAALLDDVRTQFASGVAARAGQKAQLKQRELQLRLNAEGLKKQITAKMQEIDLVASELVGVRDLWQKKLVSVGRMNELQRDNAKAHGELGQLTSAVGEVGAKLAETEVQILQVDRDTWKEDEKELEQNRARTAELLERKITAEDQLARLEVRAPQSGIVHELSVHTIGGVVTPQGDPIMLIVPQQTTLRVEAKLQPADVDQVHIGEEVRIRLSGLNARTTPELTGRVASLSADTVSDPKTGVGFFKVQVDLPRNAASQLGGVKLVPGMPSEIFIETSAPRTIISYLTKPLTDQMFRAFR